MKRYLFLILIISIFFCLVSCRKNNLDNSSHYTEYESGVPSSFDAILKTKKLYITSIGQSIDMANFLYYLEYLKEEYNFEYVDDTFLSAGDVEDGAIVFVFVGCSIKAMQESGVSIESEKARAQEFINKRNSRKITVVAWHTGGTSRRGSTSDELIALVASNADLFIFSKTGNGDYFLSDTATKNNVPLCEIESASSVRAPLIVMLGSK